MVESTMNILILNSTMLNCKELEIIQQWMEGT